MGDRSLRSNKVWPLILGGLLHRPRLWVAVLGAIIPLLLAPLMPATGFNHRLEVAVISPATASRDIADFRSAEPTEQISLDLGRLLYREKGSDVTRKDATKLLAEAARSPADITGLDASFALPTELNLHAIATLTRLERLGLGAVDDDDAADAVDLSPLLGCLSLRVLVADRWDFTPEQLRTLGRLPLLEELAVGTRDLSLEQAKAIAGMPALQRLHVPSLPRSVAAIAPLQDAPGLDEIFLEQLAGEAFDSQAKRISRILPGVRLSPGIVRTPDVFGPFAILAGVFSLSMFGLPLLLWTSGPLPRVVPGYAEAHLRTAWAIIGVSLLLVGVSAWLTGLPVVRVTAAAAAVLAAIWCLQLRGQLPLMRSRVARTAEDFQSNLCWMLAFSAAAVLGYLLLFPGEHGAVLTATLGVVAAAAMLLLDRALKHRVSGAQAPPAGNEAAASSPERLAAVAGWPLRAEGSAWVRALLRPAVVGTVGSVGLLLVAPHFLGLSRRFPLMGIFLYGPTVMLLFGPVQIVHKRWPVRIASLRVLLPVPGERSERVRACFNGIALDTLSLLPWAVAVAALAGSAASAFGGPFDPRDAAVVGFSALIAYALIDHGATARGWRRPMLAALATIPMFVLLSIPLSLASLFGRPLPWCATVLLLTSVWAVGLNRLARRRELAREWG